MLTLRWKQENDDNIEDGWVRRPLFGWWTLLLCWERKSWIYEAHVRATGWNADAAFH